MASLNIDQWTPEDVAQWIKGLGPQFESCSEGFVDEEINGKALLTINTEYLTELSIENANDQNAILDAVHCLIEVDSCLQEETVHGQVIVVNDQTKTLIDKLDKESQDAGEGDITTSESCIKIAGQVYQLAKKLLSWLLRSPFSEMNACWPLKDSVCRVVRDMTDESLLKNRAHLHENLKKLQISFDNFLNEEPLHEVFKQSPILVDEEFTLEGEGLGIGITTSHNIHTVNSVAPESPAGKNGNIKNGDEIVNVNGQCVIAWPQKNVVSLMKAKPDLVSLTLKKLPPVKGPLNKPLDKPGTPLSEMNVVMDRTKVAPERPARVEMKEAGIKEETSLEMQAIENENASEENSQVEARIKGIEEVDEGKQGENENENEKKTNGVENVPEKESVDEETKHENAEETPAKEDETEAKPESPKESEKQEASAKVVENGQPETDVKVDEKKVENGEASETAEDDNAAVVLVAGAAGEPESKDSAEVQGKTEEVSNGGNDEAQVEVNGDAKEEGKEQEKNEVVESEKKDEKVVNGEATTTTAEKAENSEAKNAEEISQSKSKKADENEAGIQISVQSPSPKKEAAKPSVTENVENGTSAKKEPTSPSKKPARPELPKMRVGSVKNVTVGGASAKQVEVYGTTVVMREKKINGAPNKRISCIELGEADCEGWLTKKSGGHGITPTRWRRQWCVLKEDHLYYYKTSFDREAGGVIDITGYSVSAAPEVKKPFAFKCLKDGAKKYFFHADNEVDRDTWTKSLNSASRGERKQKETGLGQMSEAAEHRGSALKVAQSNRPRTGSVLAGIRFNYYDDDDVEENRKITSEPSAAQRVNDALNGQKDDANPSTAGDVTADQNVLKIADGVEEDACQVVPVGEIEGDKETDAKDKGSSEEGKSELQVKGSEEPPKESTTNEGNVEHKEDKAGEVSASKDTAGPKEAAVEDSKDDVGTQEANEEAKESTGTGEVSVEDKTIKVNGQTGTEETVAKESEDSTAKPADNAAKPEDDALKPEDDAPKPADDASKPADDAAKPEDDASKPEDDASKPEDDASKPEDDASKPEDDASKPEDGASKPEDDASKPEDDASKPEDDASKPEDDAAKPEVGASKPEDDASKPEDDTAKPEDGASKPEDDASKPEEAEVKPEEAEVKSENGTAKPEDSTEKSEAEKPKSEDVTGDSTTKSDSEAGASEEKPKDEFEEVAESIQDANIGLDGTEKSPAALLRRLSLNSQNEIMDKVVKLRVLKQNLKDKEESMGTIDELLSSDVTPESIAEWRAKYETVTKSNSNDLNQNS